MLALLACAWCATGLLSTPPQRFDQDAYIWQMRWKDPLRTAVRDGADVVRAWRVLFAHIDAHGQVRRPDVDSEVLRSAGRPVVVVIRIEGQIEHFDAADLQAKVLAVVEQARGTGLSIAGVEIDHDCASAQLARYTRFLASIRTAVQAGTRVSITALPAWLASPDLPGLLQQADEAVLQLHAVSNPRQGLFNGKQALDWTRRFNAITSRPFRVALPTYGSRLHYDGFGNLSAIESEAPVLDGGSDGTEWVVSPDEVQGFLRALSHHASARLQGVVWFRLPTSDDSRAWHTNTWRALATGAPLRAELRLAARAADGSGLFDIVLQNVGTTDALWPRVVDLPHYCTVFDGVNAYRALGIAAHSPALEAVQNGMLKPQRAMLIGWARCQHNPEQDLHAAS